MPDYFELADTYYAKFGDYFPNMNFMSDSDEECMKKMQACLDTGIPAEELYNISNDEQISY